MRRNKGKLICKIGNLALHLESYATGEPTFKFVFVDENDFVKESAEFDIAAAVFLKECFNKSVDECMSHNIRKGLLDD